MGVLIYVGLMLYDKDTWAFSERPIGSVNAFAEGGDWYSHVEAQYGEQVSGIAACGGEDWSYAYSPSFVMDDPICELNDPFELIEKAPGAGAWR